MTNSVLILGATSDMALALAYTYAQLGHNLILAARKEDRLEPVASDIKIKHNVEVKTVFFDAVDPKDNQSFIKKLGVKPLITIAVFGYLGNHDQAKDDWVECSKIIDINFVGAVAILNTIANLYEQEKKGTIVGISSVAGDRGRQSNYFYGSAKAGFTAYLSGLRNRLYKSGVHVLTVKPGFVNTKMTADLDLPPALTVQPDDVAKAIVKGINKKKNTIYISWKWRYIMLIIKSIPERIFKKLKL